MIAGLAKEPDVQLRAIFILGAVPCALLLACAQLARPTTPSAAQSAATAPQAPPTGKLPRDVVPLGYGLGLEIVPGADSFSGHVRVSVELAQPLTTIWLHAKGLHVSQARAELAGKQVAAN